METDDVACVSDYELIRLQNIKRNEQYLQTIGIEKKSLSSFDKLGHNSKRKKSNESIISLPTRRSKRVADLPVVAYTETTNFIVQSNKKNEAFKTRDDYDIDIGVVKGLVDDKVNVVKKDFIESSRIASILNANFEYFLKDRLCVPVDSYGKAKVMELSNHGIEPKFSKYPGAVEWNNCIYLWVNIGGTSDYVNAFTDNGRYIMWYGGSKMRKDSRIIQRLATARKKNISGIDFKKSATSGYYDTILSIDDKKLSKIECKTFEEGNISSGTDVLLFVRLEGGNYCCLGRLLWVAIDLLSQPVKIKWELVDYDTIYNTDYFKHILQI